MTNEVDMRYITEYAGYYAVSRIKRSKKKTFSYDPFNKRQNEIALKYAMAYRDKCIALRNKPVIETLRGETVEDELSEKYYFDPEYARQSRCSDCWFHHYFRYS